MRLKFVSGCLMILVVFVSSTVVARAEADLVDAVKNANRAIIQALLQKPGEVNKPEPDGTTALHWAAYLDDTQTAKLLIAAGANVKAVNRQGVTPLALACINGNAAVIDMLLNAGADANSVLREGETALMTAARTGVPEAVKTLLAHGANVNAKEGWRGQTALMWAAAEGHAAVVDVLLQGGADMNVRSNGGLTALLFAVREGKTEAVRALLKAGADVNQATLPPPTTRGRAPGSAAPLAPLGGTSSLVLAVGNGHFELASFMLDAGADPNASAQGWTALHQVTWVRNPGYGTNNPAPEGSGNIDSLEIVRRLVAHGANLNARMTRRADMGTTDLNNVGATPFLLAARAGDAALMRLLVTLGADPLMPNADNTTPLLAAAGVGTHSPGEDAGRENDVLEAVRLALELGGDPNAVDNNGETAMHGAAYKQFPSVVKFLADKGAKVEVWNQKDKYGWTPLMIAAGVQRENNIRSSAETAAAIRAALGDEKTANTAPK